MRQLSFAIIGCGRIAQRHAVHIANTGKLVAVCDVDATKADTLAHQYGAKSYYNLDELLAKEKEIDVVTVCTPNGLHAAHAIEALKNGCHVLCEKPLAINMADATAMLQAAAQCNRKLFVIKQNRYNPPVAAVKKVLEEGRLGTLYSIQLSCFWNRDKNYYSDSWRGTKALDGGTLFTQFSHFIDLLYWMLGDVEKVHAFTANYAHKGIIEFEDTGVVIVQFANGVIGTINYTVNSFQKNMEGSLTLFGEKGSVKIGGQYLNVLEYQNIEGYTIANLPEGKEANNYGTYQGSMSNHDKVYEAIAENIINNSKETNAWDGLKTVEIISKIYNAANGL